MKRKIAILALVLSSLAQAANVFVTETGQKYYHTYRDCGRLDHSKAVLVADEKEAQSHGLVQCPICAHRHHARTVDGQNKNWAKPETK